MIGEEPTTEDLARIRVLFATQLNTLTDAISAHVEAIYANVNARMGDLQDSMKPPITSLYSGVMFNSPEDDEEGPFDWSAVQRIRSELQAQVADVAAPIDAATASLRNQVADQIGMTLPSLPEVVGGLFKLLADVFSRLLGDTPDLGELWGSLVDTIEPALSASAPGTSGWLVATLLDVANGLGKPIADHDQETLAALADLVNHGAIDGATVEQIIAQWQSYPRPIKAVINVAVLFVAAIPMMQAMSVGVVERYRQRSMAQVQPTPLSLPQLIELVQRKDVGVDWARQQALRLGYSRELFDTAYKLSRVYLPVGQYVEMFRRTGDYSFLSRLSDIGISDADIGILSATSNAVPTASDVVRFLARDVFDAAAIASGKLDEDFPQKYREDWFRQAGVNRDTALLYWMAHWSLPSPTQMYEMYHRGYIDIARLRDGIKLADYAPGWVDNLIKIAYNVPGRIDVRRMWETGVISDRDVLVQRHKDMGYSPEDAETLATFVEQLKTQKDENEADRKRAPIAAQIVKSYVVGTLSDADATSALVSLGYSPETAALKLQEGMFGRARDRADRVRDSIGREYVRGFMTPEDAAARLAYYGFDGPEISSLFDSWQLDRELYELTDERKHEKDLNKSEIINGYNERILTRDDAGTALVTLGYDATEADAILRIEDAQQQRKDAKLVEQSVHAQFVNRRMEASDARDTLLGFGYTTDQIAALISRWDVEREAKRPELSNANLQRMIELGIVPEERAERELLARGYTASDAALIMSLWGTEVGLTEQQLNQKASEFDIREKRLNRGLDLQESFRRDQLASQERRTAAAQTGIQERFDDTLEQRQALQTQRLQEASVARAETRAAQTERDAASFASRREVLEKQIAARADQQARSIDAATQRANDAASQRQALADQRDTLSRDLSSAADARQQRTIQSSIERLDRSIAAAAKRQEDAARNAQDLTFIRDDLTRQRDELRAQVQEARDVRLNAQRIQQEARAEQTRIRTETRAGARKDLTSAAAAGNAADLASVQAQRDALSAELAQRLASLEASAAESRAASALALRQDAERRLAAATPAVTLMDTGF